MRMEGGFTKPLTGDEATHALPALWEQMCSFPFFLCQKKQFPFQSCTPCAPGSPRSATIGWCAVVFGTDYESMTGHVAKGQVGLQREVPRAEPVGTLLSRVLVTDCTCPQPSW